MAYIEHTYDPEERRRRLLQQQEAMGPLPESATPPLPALHTQPPPSVDPLARPPVRPPPPPLSEPMERVVPEAGYLGESDFYAEDPVSPVQSFEEPPPEVADPRDSFGYRLSAIGDVANNLRASRDRMWNLRYPGTVQQTPRREVGQAYMDRYYREQARADQQQDRVTAQERQTKEDAYQDRQRAYKEERLDPNSEVSRRQAAILESMPGVAKGSFVGKMSAQEMDSYGSDYVGLVRVAQEKDAARAGKIQYLQSAVDATVAGPSGQPEPLPEGLRNQIAQLGPDSPPAMVDALGQELQDWQRGRRGEQSFARSAAAGGGADRAGKVRYLQSTAGSTVADQGGQAVPLPEGLRQQIEGLNEASSEAEVNAIAQEVQDWQRGRRGEQRRPPRGAVAAGTGTPGAPAASRTHRSTADLYNMSVEDRAAYMDQLEQERQAMPTDARGASVADKRFTDEITRIRQINEREVPGLKQTPAVTLQAAKDVRAAAAAQQNIDRLAGEAKRLTPSGMLDAAGRGIAAKIPGTKSVQLQRDLEQRAMSIYLELKNLHTLGVLAGPDMEVLDKSSGNPAQMSALIFGDTGQSLDILRDDVRHKFEIKAKNSGYLLPGDENGGRPQRTAAAPPRRATAPRQLPEISDDVGPRGEGYRAFDTSDGLGVTTETRPSRIPRADAPAGALPMQLRDPSTVPDQSPRFVPMKGDAPGGEGGEIQVRDPKTGAIRWHPASAREAAIAAGYEVL